jgi:putative SOS response-associated peptidase YedK
MCYNVSLIEGLNKMRHQNSLFDTVKDRKAFDGLKRYNALRLENLPIVAYREQELRAFNALWWLIPHWSKTGKPEAVAFNARVETIDKSPMFSPYFKSSRCLFPISAFYEYSEKEKITIELNGKAKVVKTPYLFRMKKEEPFMLGGIFSVWKNEKTGEELPSFAVLTTEPNPLVKKVHNRMPVIIPEGYYKLWLDREYKDVKELANLAARPYDHAKMLSKRVNAQYLYDRTHQDKECWQGG